MIVELICLDADKNPETVLNQLESLDSQETLVLVFDSLMVNEQPHSLKMLMSVFKKSVLMGCSSAGSIIEDRLCDQQLVLAIVKFEHTRIKAVSTRVSDLSESFDSGARIGHLANGDELSGLMVLSDGLNVNGSELLRGIGSVVPSTVPIFGGLAADGSRFKETWVVVDGKFVSKMVSALAFSGKAIRFSSGSRGGWKRFGPDRRVTKSKGNILYELDHKPALEVYKRYLGSKASQLPASALLFPLQVWIESPYVLESEKLVRTVLAVDEASGSMTFAGDIPEGATAHLMHANLTGIIEASGDAPSDLADATHIKGAVLNLAVSCVGRRLILGERTNEELECARMNLSSNTKQIGFYSYGEIAAGTVTQTCQLHNQTMTMTSFYEDPSGQK